MTNTVHEVLQGFSVHGIKPVLRLAVNIQHADDDVIVGTATRPCVHKVLGSLASQGSLVCLRELGA